MSRTQTRIQGGTQINVLNPPLLAPNQLLIDRRSAVFKTPIDAAPQTLSDEFDVQI